MLVGVAVRPRRGAGRQPRTRAVDAGRDGGDERRVGAASAAAPTTRSTSDGAGGGDGDRRPTPTGGAADGGTPGRRRADRGRRPQAGGRPARRLPVPAAAAQRRHRLPRLQPQPGRVLRPLPRRRHDRAVGPARHLRRPGPKGGLAWIAVLQRDELRPREGVRQVKLVWYNDDLDPNKTLQYTQRLNEVDKVLLIGGITSPEAIADYLERSGVPLIGDIGLSPSRTTAPRSSRRAPCEVSLPAAGEARPSASAPRPSSVIQDVLPAVDTEQSTARRWVEAAQAGTGVELLELRRSTRTSTRATRRCSTRSATEARVDHAAGRGGADARLHARGRHPAGRARVAGLAVAQGLDRRVEPAVRGRPVQPAVRRHVLGRHALPRPADEPHPSRRKNYLENMANYAPSIDITGFIAINYYHAGLLQFKVIKQGGILDNLSRANVLKAAAELRSVRDRLRQHRPVGEGPDPPGAHDLRLRGRLQLGRQPLGLPGRTHCFAGGQ